jgi:hypothetical protein
MIEGIMKVRSHTWGAAGFVVGVLYGVLGTLAVI